MCDFEFFEKTRQIKLQMNKKLQRSLKKVRNETTTAATGVCADARPQNRELEIPCRKLFLMSKVVSKVCDWE